MGWVDEGLQKLKEYVEGTGSGNWWGVNREEKRDLYKNRKLPFEFSESMYNEMESFVGKRQIFGRASDVVDSDRLGSPPPKNLPGLPPPHVLQPMSEQVALPQAPQPYPTLPRSPHPGTTFSGQLAASGSRLARTIWWTL